MQCAQLKVACRAACCASVIAVLTPHTPAASHCCHSMTQSAPQCAVLVECEETHLPLSVSSKYTTVASRFSSAVTTSLQGCQQHVAVRGLGGIRVVRGRSQYCDTYQVQTQHTYDQTAARSLESTPQACCWSLSYRVHCVSLPRHCCCQCITHQPQCFVHHLPLELLSCRPSPVLH
jgi:hypothetical protein